MFREIGQASLNWELFQTIALFNQNGSRNHDLVKYAIFTKGFSIRDAHLWVGTHEASKCEKMWLNLEKMSLSSSNIVFNPAHVPIAWDENSNLGPYTDFSKLLLSKSFNKCVGDV